MKNGRNEKIADSLESIIQIFRIMKGYGEKSGVRILPMDPRHSVLGFLVNRDLPMSELGERLARSKPNMTAIIDSMIKDGLVRRKGDPKDRRVVKISITPKGRKQLMKKKKEIRDIIGRNFGRLDDRDLGSLCTSLEKVNSIITKLEAD